MAGGGSGIDSEKEPEAHQTDAANQSDIAPVTPPIRPPDTPDSQRDSQDDKPRRDLLDKLNFVVLCGAFLAALYAGIQAHRLADSTDTAISNASDDARKQRNIAADTSLRQLRAYVFLDPANPMAVARFPSVTDTVEIEVHVKNTGLTPAYDLMSHTWVILEKWPLRNDFSFTGPENPNRVSKTIVPAGGITMFHVGSARPLTQGELDALKSGELRLYIYGRFDYRDTYGNPRYTNFCLASTTEAAKGYKHATANCALHNEAN